MVGSWGLGLEGRIFEILRRLKEHGEAPLSPKRLEPKELRGLPTLSVEARGS